VDELSKEEQEKISRFIELSLSLIIRGFDEMEMQKRLELIRLLGTILNIGFEKTYGRIITLEKRIFELEKSRKKK
jgi:hypothetical protein